MIGRVERAAALTLAFLLFARPAAGDPTPAASPDGATYVGAAACAPCHERETKLWRGSHHDRAMEKPTPATVRGDFADTTFTKDGVTTTFSRRGGRLRTSAPTGPTASCTTTASPTPSASTRCSSTCSSCRAAACRR